MLTQLKKGTLELCVLAQLAKRDCYGYDLVTTISKEIEVTLGTIYPLLKRIKDNGYVESEIRESGDGPARKYYRLTTLGREVLSDSISEWHDFSHRINRIIGGKKDD